MKRRDSIKSIALASFGASLFLESCYGVSREKITRSLTRYDYGRTPEETLYDDKLFAQKFFTNDELLTLDKLCNLILPPNEFGSIRDAEVVQLIEFMAKDIPSYQNPLRSGLVWIDQESKNRFNNIFINFLIMFGSSVAVPIVATILVDRGNFNSVIICPLLLTFIH